MRRTVRGQVFASSADMDRASHVRLAQLALDLTKRKVEAGRHAVLMLDSLTRLGRAFNLHQKSSGRTMSGGVDIRALEVPKRIFGAARAVEGGGSLTIIATALVETGSSMDELIFQEFKGTGTMELVLDRELADERIFPAINLNASGTRREELLFGPAAGQHQALRRSFSRLSPRDAMLSVQKLLARYPDNSPKQIVHGNERVLRARLSDARFFFDQDRKQSLAARVPRLANVVYHNKLGSQLARVERLVMLAGEIADRLGADRAAAERAAYLAKADLLTDMVGEFPELQGIMGRYYADHDGEPATVAVAIEQHYWPKVAGGALPEDPVAVSLALTDKLDTLVGIFGCGLLPSGDKDPFGLRRAALGVVRLLMEKRLPLDVRALFELARGHFAAGVLADSVAQDLHAFTLERLKPYLFGRVLLTDAQP